MIGARARSAAGPVSLVRHRPVIDCPVGVAMHYLLFYDVVPDYITRRALYRDAHLEHARRAFDRGDLVLAGALADPADGAVIVFRGEEAAETFARTDPYVLNGVVTGWRVRRWSTVLGDGATVT